MKHFIFVEDICYFTTTSPAKHYPLRTTWNHRRDSATRIASLGPPSESSNQRRLLSKVSSSLIKSYPTSTF